MNQKQESMRSKMREILQEDYIELSVVSYTVHEDFQDNICRINCILHDQNTDQLVVEGHGIGTIDALFGGLKQMFAHQYPSLKSLEFSQFNIRGLHNQESTTKAQAEAIVGIRNSEGYEFVFQKLSPSINHAGIQATVEAVQYFVNSERTFVKLYEILEHYRAQGRTDLVQKYTSLVSEVVENTSYSEVVENIKNALQ